MKNIVTLPKMYVFSVLFILWGSSSFSQSVKASSFGFDPLDATRALVSAMNSPYDSIIIDVQKSDWIIQPVTFRKLHDKVIIFEKDVVLRAKKGAFSRRTAVLLGFSECQNIKIIGNDAILQMNKAEYLDGEWRHGISLRGCENISIDCLTIKDSGGDGIYIAGTKEKNYSKDIHISNISSMNNKRQGMSIISAVNVQVRTSTFSDTKGTLPGAGLDIEPNSKEDRIQNIQFIDCIFNNNDHAGILVSLRKLEKESAPISIGFKNCVLQNNHSKTNKYVAAEIVFGANRSSPVKGSLVFENCIIENSKWGLFHSRKTNDAFTVTFKNCIARNICTEKISAVISLEVPNYKVDKGALGGYIFDNLVLEYEAEVPFFQVRGSSLGTLSQVADIEGDITIVSSQEKKANYIKYNPTSNKNVNLKLTQKKPKN